MRAARIVLVVLGLAQFLLSKEHRSCAAVGLLALIYVVVASVFDPWKLVEIGLVVVIGVPAILLTAWVYQVWQQRRELR